MRDQPRRVRVMLSVTAGLERRDSVTNEHGIM